jgi:hypothetical protein
VKGHIVEGCECEKDAGIPYDRSLENAHSLKVCVTYEVGDEEEDVLIWFDGLRRVCRLDSGSIA